jgi:hypothetical protein
MRIHKGKTRIVFVFPGLGVVVKLPIIQPKKAIDKFIMYQKRFGWKLTRQYLSWPAETPFGFKWLMFLGILCNWREFIYYVRTHNPFLQPTYFSLFGLLNIQLYGEVSNIDFGYQLDDLTDWQIRDDPHHFSNSGNFCFYKGKARMLDYGNPKCWETIEKYGEKIVKEFDPAYNWEEEKKKRREAEGK